MSAKSPSVLLKQKKAAVLRCWTDLVFETYASDTAAILKAGGDRFANPVSYNVSCNLEKIVDGLIEGKKAETLFSCLEEIIRVRAVQEFTPEEAVCFMPLLKKALLSEAGIEAGGQLKDNIDHLVAACPNIYRDCRNRIDRIRANEKMKMQLNMARLSGLQEGGK